MRKREKSCTTCKHSVWCETWAEYKCNVKIKRVYEPLRDAQRCKDYKEDKYKSEVKCRCKDCLSRASDDIQIKD